MFGLESLIPVAGSVLGGLLGGSGGNASTTQNKEPWGPAQDWLKSNISTGQSLQNYYQQNPFSDAQKQAYGNSFGMSDMYRQMMPQLMSQMPTGTFNRTSPLQRPQMMNFTPQGGNLGFGSHNTGAMFSNPYTNGSIPAAPVQAAPTNPWGITSPEEIQALLRQYNLGGVGNAGGEGDAPTSSNAPGAGDGNW